MVEIKFLVTTDKFEKDVKKIKNGSIKLRLKKQIKKISENPNVGKPLKHDLKGERTVYIKPFRLIYTVQKDKLILLKFEHRNGVY